MGSKEDADAWWSDWLHESNSILNLGTTFNLINYLKSVDDSAVLSVKPDLAVTTPKDQDTAFKDMQTKIAQKSTVPLSKWKQFRRAKRWWLRQLKFDNFEKFSLTDLKDAISKINRKSIGKDKVPFKFIPTADSHLKKFLSAINSLVFSGKSLPKQFLQTRTTFIPKANSAKLRGLSIASRVACLVELMISSRFMSLISNIPAFNNRYGFLRGRSVDNVISDLVNRFWKNNAEHKKQALVSFDLTSAYDVVSYCHLLVKIKRAIQSVGNYARFSILFGFTLRWIFGRSTVFNGVIAIFRRGLPQGSPLSCFCFVVFFDFDIDSDSLADLLSAFYADDSNYLTAGTSWNEVEDNTIFIHEKFSAWSHLNGQSLNETKSVVLFIRRKCEVSPTYSLFDAVKPKFRCLGVVLDQNFSFSPHINFLKKWLSHRTAIFRKLRFELGISAHVLLRALLSFRNRCLFGSWWILQCSDTNFNSLNASFTACLRGALGFSKLVPNSEVHSFAGIPSLTEYLPYWFSTRVLGLNLHGHSDIFTMKSELKSSILNYVPTISYNLRKSTLITRESSLISSSNYFPESVDFWHEKCLEIMAKGEELIRNLGPVGYKDALKRIYVPRLIDKNTIIAPGVKFLNEKYYNLRVN